MKSNFLKYIASLYTKWSSLLNQHIILNVWANKKPHRLTSRNTKKERINTRSQIGNVDTHTRTLACTHAHTRLSRVTQWPWNLTVRRWLPVIKDPRAKWQLTSISILLEGRSPGEYEACKNTLKNKPTDCVVSHDFCQSRERARERLWKATIDISGVTRHKDGTKVIACESARYLNICNL